VNLSKLRDVLPDRGLVAFDDGRYHLRLPPEAIDLHRFRAGIEAARARADTGDPRGAVQEFETACAEWRGPPFEESFGIAPVDAARERAERLHVDALRDYAAALLVDERPDEVVRTLEPFVDAHLTDEGLAGQLMLGLYGASRQSEALRLFARVADALDELHGVKPGPELQAIADTIVLQTATPDRARGAAPFAPVRHRRPVRFVGRPAELAALHATWARAVDGAPQLARISGEGGIGKSALVNRFVDDIAAAGGTVMAGICEPDPVEHFQPFPQLVRDALARAPATDTAPTVLGELHHLGPDFAGRLPEPDEPAAPDAGRQRLFQAVASLLTDAVGPRLIVVDDIHWAGSDSVDLFRQVLRSTRGQVMIVVTYRPDQLGDDHPFRRSLGHGRLARPDLDLTLGAMDRNELGALIDAVASSERRQEFHRSIDALEEISAGNPLWFREVLRQLELEPATPIAEILPEDFRTLIDRRLTRLDPDLRRMLGIGAVLGRVFRLETAAEIAGITVDAALDLLDVGIGNGLVVDGPAFDDYSFAHPLIRNAVYYTQVRGRRVRTHVRCAELLLERRRATGAPTWAEIARHLVAARPVSDPATTAECAQRAGDDALTRFAHGEAAEWYGAALASAEETLPAHDVARIRLDHAIALGRSGQVDASRRELRAVTDEARALGDRDLLTDAVVAMTPSEAILDATFADTLRVLADEALTHYDADDPIRVRLLRTQSMAGVYLRPEVLDAWADEADRLAARTDDPTVRYCADTVRYMAALKTDDITRLELTRAALAHCRLHGLRVEEGMTSKRLLSELLLVGDHAAFEEELARFAHHAQVTSLPTERYWVAALAATRGLMVEASAATEELIRGAARIGHQVQVAYGPGLELLQLFALRYQQGRSREVTAELRTPDDEAAPVVAGTALLAIALAESGRVEHARAVLDRAVRDRGVLLPRDNFLLGALGLFAGVAAVCGTSGQRRVLYDALMERPDRFCVFGSAGAVFGTSRHWLARLARAEADDTTAAEHLRIAARLCDDAGARYWAERARREQAELVGV
jgi:hypothetical protein